MRPETVLSLMRNAKAYAHVVKSFILMPQRVVSAHEQKKKKKRLKRFSLSIGRKHRRAPREAGLNPLISNMMKMKTQFHRSKQRALLEAAQNHQKR